MKIQLTKRQAYYIVGAMRNAINPDYPMSDPMNATYIRIIDKIEKEL